MLASSALLQAHGLSKSYGRRKVVDQVSLEVAAGEVVGLLGPNGAGKTTCFYMLVGLIASDAGQIRSGHAERIAASSDRADDRLRPVAVELA
ncbi:MAG: ATP-binding cassette domain-containing protein, partial [Betaproteobacteria bacterium]|nr:ATP-binding cassette domain-containing protein [Betaproteobacteria bacterium]